jgi:integrase
MSFVYEGRQVRRSTGTSDKRLAEAILGKIRGQIVEGRFFEKPKEELHTFEELMERYLTEHAARRGNKQREQYCVNNLREFFRNPDLRHITPKQIVTYKNKRFADGVKAATINRELTTLKKAFNLARREWEWCTDNPVCRVSMERENNTRVRWLTAEEEMRLLDVSVPWFREVAVFALNTGMRMGEITALTWAGVDLFRRTVTVFRSKNGERRTIPANETVQSLLKQKHLKRDNNADLVFMSQAKTALDGANIRRALASALKKSKIQDFHFHDLRHTCATRMVQAGVDLYKVQRILGHKSPVMTQRYAHHYPESLRDGVEALEMRRTFSTNLAQSPSSSGAGPVSC